ncbi:MAG: chromate efflux transporter [Chloroflexi bacterium]|nr:chromate efflux transporter [Chloroflexota bacterium]
MPSHNVTLREAFWVWVKVAIYSFGGPAGQIAVMHKLLVEEKRWVSENRFLHALNYTMLLPGPEAQQLAVYLGWLLHKTKGGLIAGTLFVLPGFVSILLLSILYAGFQEITLVQALFYGLKPAVLAVVLEAVMRIGRRSLKNGVMVTLSGLAFVGIFFFNIPFPIIVLVAGITGFVGGKLWLETFDVVKQRQTGAESENDYVITDSIAQAQKPSTRYAAQVAIVGALLWNLPLLLTWPLLGRSHVFVEEAIFFSKTAVVTFGGAYAVLAYVAQQAVEVFGWLKPGEMLDGLGMAETTPGPLIQVVQFVGFMGAYRNPGSFSPLQAGVIGSIITTWVTYVPCFIWIFLGAPFIEFWRNNKSLTTALSGITAAVVGVILNLAVWFALQTLFGVVDEYQFGPLRLLIPQWRTVDSAALFIAVAAFVALFRFKLSMLITLAGSAALGIVYYLLILA